MKTTDIAERLLSCSPRNDSRALSAAERGIADYIASSLLASGEEAVIKLRDLYLPEAGGQTGAFLPGAGRPEDKALFYGFRAHFLDVDDVHSHVRGHPSAVILSALFAAAPEGTGGIAFLESYIAGTELMARLGESVNPALYEKGFHNTAVLGGIAAAGALSRLRGFDSAQTARAMGIAATRASGLRAQFGSDVKALHAGFAASAAVQAVNLTAHGFSSGEDVLFGKNGFFPVYGGNPAPLDLPWEGPFRIHAPGLWFKKYTFCSAAMAASDASEILRDRFPYTPEDIRSVTLRYFPGKDSALVSRMPETGEEGRFSPEYISLLGLLGIKKDRNRFSAAPVDKGIAALLPRCGRETITGQAGPPFTELTVERTDGTRDAARVTDPKGSPSNPLSVEDILDKLTEAAGGKRRAKALIRAVRNLDSTPLNELLTVL